MIHLQALRSLARVVATALIVVSGWAASPSSAAAHPHMFFDAQARWVFDDEGRLAGVRVAFAVDELNTLFTIQQLGLDADADGVLTDAEIGIVVRQMLIGMKAWDYFTELTADDTAVAFGEPREAGAILENGVLGVTFVLPLATPRAPGAETLRLRLYDPTYFVEVTMQEAPKIEGGRPDACVPGFSPFDIAAETARLQQILSELSVEQTPTIDNVGAFFADEATLVCTE